MDLILKLLPPNLRKVAVCILLISGIMLVINIQNKQNEALKDLKNYHALPNGSVQPNSDDYDRLQTDIERYRMDKFLD